MKTVTTIGGILLLGALALTRGSTFPRIKRHAHYSIHSLRGGSFFGEREKIQPEGSVLVGNISQALQRIFSRSGAGINNAAQAFRLTDLAAILCWAFLPQIVLRFVSDRVVNKTIRRKNPLQFDDTPYLAPISKLICQMGQLGLLVYFGELFLVFLGGLGVPQLEGKPKLLASLVFSVWVAQLLCALTSHLLEEAFKRYHSGNQSLSSRKVIYDRFIDAAIYLVVTLLFLDYNSIDVGVAIASLLTLGGVSSIVVGLALKEPVTEIVQGTNLLLSDKFSTGDTIRLGDGSMCTVAEMRWTDITMRGSDNSFLRMPHSQVAKSRIVNLSRMPHSQVSQELKIPNKGHAKIKVLLEDIQKEMRKSCPLLIDDSSEPFRVHWTDLDEDKAVISIESHFRIPRLGNAYWENRQEVLTAISRAVEKYNADDEKQEDSNNSTRKKQDDSKRNKRNQK